MVEVASKITDKAEYGWTFAWKVTIRNHSNSKAAAWVGIQFLDSEGFEVSESTAGVVTIAGDSQDTFTGALLIPLPKARDVSKTIARVLALP